MKKILMGVWLSIWAAPIMLFGAITFSVLKLLGYRSRRWNDIVVFEIGKNGGGLNLGGVVIANQKPSEHLLAHESGHLYQMVVLGVLSPFIVHIPSAIRYHYHNYLVRKKSIVPKPYDSIGFEGTASQLGYKICLKKEYEWKKLRF